MYTIFIKIVYWNCILNFWRLWSQKNGVCRAHVKFVSGCVNDTVLYAASQWFSWVSFLYDDLIGLYTRMSLQYVLFQNRPRIMQNTNWVNYLHFSYFIVASWHTKNTAINLKKDNWLCTQCLFWILVLFWNRTYCREAPMVAAARKWWKEIQ